MSSNKLNDMIRIYGTGDESMSELNKRKRTPKEELVAVLLVDVLNKKYDTDFEAISKFLEQSTNEIILKKGFGGGFGNSISKSKK